MKNIPKKFLVISLIIASFSAIFSSFNPSSTLAKESFFEGNCENILGLTSWDCGVNITDEESLKSGIWLIVANIASDITVIASYLILGYVIYGGYLYIMSSGDPGKVATGKKTLTQAFIGLAIVMLANIIISSIRIVLLGGDGNLSECASMTATTPCVDPNTLIESLIAWVISIAGVVSVIFLIYGSVLYITSSGEASKIQKAKNSILYSLIGLAIVALAVVISAFVSNLIRNAESSALVNPTNNIIALKEVHETKTL